MGLPPEVIQVLSHFLTADLATLSGDGTPVTWPVLPAFEPLSGRIAVVTSIGLPAKAINARRQPNVSLLYADPLGSGLVDPPIVRVQGIATVSDEVLVSMRQIQDPPLVAALRSTAIDLLRRQPTVRVYLSNALTRRLMDWYFIRLLLTIAPRTVSWGRGDPSQWEAIDVE